jgi:fatty acid desaturase
MTRRSGARAIGAIALDWAVIVAAAAMAEASHAVVVYVIAVIVIGRQMNALFELHHHAMHGNLFRRHAWNARLQFLYSLPLGTTIGSERAEHMEHHRTFDVADSRIWGGGYGLDSARRQQPRYMVWFLCLRPFLGPLQLAEVKEFVPKAARNAAGLLWLAAAAAFFAAGRVDLFLWYWVVPRFTAYPILFFWDDMLGHYNCPRTGTREMRGLWFRLFSTHGTNFHNVHHLNPAIPWFNMKRATAAAVDEREVDVARGFIDGMRQMVFAKE